MAPHLGHLARFLPAGAIFLNRFPHLPHTIFMTSCVFPDSNLSIAEAASEQAMLHRPVTSLARTVLLLVIFMFLSSRSKDSTD
jgi:hypothetical protein